MNFLVKVNDFNLSDIMNKGFLKKAFKWIVKYLLPLLFGLFEGNTHTVEDGISSLFGF